MPLVRSGSSPLTRGKRPRAHQRALRIRLIPAHAGKTCRGGLHLGRARAHPRSRGENTPFEAGMEISVGSSPLTRGKRAACSGTMLRMRLIPAHAGKTTNREIVEIHVRAHPRSRGENFCAGDFARYEYGSSPLTRGKRTRCRRGGRRLRLIPAHAGKTRPWLARSQTPWAHPRSRGENTADDALTAQPAGSSPLTRGKQAYARSHPLPLGLIPAHAGKTPLLRRRQGREAAQPRSRGENVAAVDWLRPHRGSSPLTRGKQR